MPETPFSRYLISRRNALKSFGAAGIGIGLSGWATLPIFAAEEPVRGGILRARIAGDPPNFDMLSNNSAWVLTTVAACYNGLIKYDPRDPLNIVGDLAESWEEGEDGLSYTFKIVENAKFHDGVPLTSADVKYTFDIARDPPDGTVSARRILLAPIREIVAVDDYTIRFDLHRRSPSLLATLATGWFVVAPKHILEVKGHMKDDVVGSGPFKLHRYTRGTSVELVRNPDYHVPDRPYLDGITFFIVPDLGTAYAYLSTGQLHQFDEIPGNDARRAQAELTDVITVHRNSSYVGDPYTVNLRRQPFDDIRVRKALALSINHQEALDVVFQGDGVVAGLLPPQPWGLPADELAKIPGHWPDIEASRAEAKALLAEAGLADGFETSMVVRRGAGTHESRAIFLADQFGRIGVRVRLDVQETATYFDTMTRLDFNLATNTVTSLANDPDFLIGDFHTTQGNLNYSGLSSPVIDELYERQSQETDPVERRKIVAELEKAIMEEFTTVILYFKDKYTGMSNHVRNYVMHPEPDNNRRMEDIWLAS
jgi:peptide/nickel transport system substrate-binding protein